MCCGNFKEGINGKKKYECVICSILTPYIPGDNCVCYFILVSYHDLVFQSHFQVKVCYTLCDQSSQLWGPLYLLINRVLNKQAFFRNKNEGPSPVIPEICLLFFTKEGILERKTQKILTSGRKAFSCPNTNILWILCF